jgi:kumamolisin
MIRKIRSRRGAFALCAVSLIGFLLPSRQVTGDSVFRVSGHLLSRKTKSARFLERKAPSDRMRLAIVLRPRDPEGLENFLRRVQDPADPLFHHFLSSSEFTERFGAPDSDIQRLTEHLGRSGVRVSRVHENRLVLDLDGSAAEVEDAFQLQIHNYQLADGRVALAANNDPVVPADLAAKIQLVAGLNGFTLRKPHIRSGRELQPRSTVDDFMTPAKVRTAYNLNSVTATGAGETLALFELAGYNPADITAYAARFAIPAPTLQNVLVDGADGSVGSGADEVTLDIELAASLAPGLAKIIVYEGPNTDTGALDTYSRIATDNAAAVVSVSWGAPEDEMSAAYLNGENTIFQQMAAQGQTVFAASGDSGAFDNANQPTTLAVDDPSSQPLVTGVGGTTLVLGPGNSYGAESSWGSGSSGGGGGVSRIWAIPAWQASVGTNKNGESTTHRMVPDVSFDGNPQTGYPIYFGGKWYVYGGTSCGAPLWAAFASLVNQKRVADGLGRLGFVNPALYQVARSAQYFSAYHDVDDGTDNLYFPAVPDYDLSTGWGSFNGAGLFASLTAPALPAVLAAPGVPGGLTVKEAR